MTNIVFVCEGNICRSPMAEALLKERLAAVNNSSVHVSSCGLDTRLGRRARPELGAVIGAAYFQLRDFHSRPISHDIVGEADLLLVMEEQEVHHVLSMFPEAKGKVTTVTGFAGQQGEIRDFVDALDGDLIDWLRDCYAKLDLCIDALFSRIVKADLTV